jgi:hypothetical protein
MEPLTPEQKLELCRQCEHFRSSTQQCKLCGCFMPLKVLMPLACPAEKWER